MKTKNYEKRENISKTVFELSDYWPLTLRQVYYRLVASGLIENKRTAYQMLSKILAEMRYDDLIPWNAIEDRTRRTSEKRGKEDAEAFILDQTSKFLRNYARCRIQGQERHIEIWVEKDALSSIFERIAWPYCVRVSTARGYQSTTKLHEFGQRAVSVIAKGQTPTVLYFGDFDPSGLDMFEVAQSTLTAKMGIPGIDFIRIALNIGQIDDYSLPNNPDALKLTDSRAAKFRKKYGDVSVELDALHPRQIEQMISESIQSLIDMELFQEQMEIEKVEAAQIDRLRLDIQAMISERLVTEAIGRML